MSDAPAAVSLRWRTGLILCLLPMLALMALFSGIAAVRPSVADDMADGRRGALIEASMSLTVGGVNAPLALLALYLCWTFARFGWRWADEVAVTATAHGLVPHRSTLMKPIPWSDIREVQIDRSARTSRLLIRLGNGGSRSIRGIDLEAGAVARFMAYARERTVQAVPPRQRS